MIVELTQSTGGWWESHGENVPSWLSVYVGMEQTARYIEKTQQVAEYRAAFVSLWEQAVPMKEFTP